MQIKQSFNKILVPLDLSETSLTVLPIARTLAINSQSELHILCVNVSQVAMVHAAGSGVPSAMQTPTNEQMLDRMKDAIGDSLAETDAHLSVVEDYDPADAIIKYADQNDIELIILTTHGYSGLTRLLLGSVAESVIRKSSCPVLTFKASH